MYWPFLFSGGAAGTGRSEGRAKDPSTNGFLWSAAVVRRQGGRGPLF
jgi:hypothetical protein